MPTKKKTEAPLRQHETVLVTTEIDASLPNLPKVPASAKCEHINRHSHGLDRKLDNVVCDKPKGHGGDHEGEHEEYVKEYETTIENGIEKTRVLLVAQKRRVQWGDMAGIPFDKIPRPEPPQPPTLATLSERMAKLEKSRVN